MTDTNTSTLDVSIAALCAWREASGEGEQGMRAVLHVIANRSRKWNKSILAVVTQPKQFSSMTIRGDANGAVLRESAFARGRGAKEFARLMIQATIG